MRSNSKFITVHSLEALEACEFSIIVANVPYSNESEVIKLFGGDPSIYLEYHNYKHNVKFCNQ